MNNDNRLYTLMHLKSKQPGARSREISCLVLSDQSDYVSERDFALAPDYYRLPTSRHAAYAAA